MVFSSTVFLFVFLPIVFLVTKLVKNIKFNNVFLTIVSLIFYAWGEPKYVFLMLAVVGINYIFGLLINYKNQYAKPILIASVLSNLLILGYFKYMGFFVSNVNSILGNNRIAIPNIILPIGVSFFIFQAMSYTIDLYRKEIKVQKNPLYLALYISFFPQLIAGPIVRYCDIEKQIEHRILTPEKTTLGIKRFVLGLSKKVILANTFAVVVDTAFSWGMDTFGTFTTWLIMILYASQIYFDFSGYSDMAIGMSKMFGFDFPENFNFPYVSKSIQEFWRRWHISLSTWFKEYLYIPLGGNRKGKTRTYINLIIVFFCTGFWHGSSWNFVIWGLWHGLFIVIERLFLGKFLKNRKFSIVANIYANLVVLVGWVFFRAETMGEASKILQNMFTIVNGQYSALELASPKVIFFMVVGIFFVGIHNFVFAKFSPKINQGLLIGQKTGITEMVYLFVLLAVCMVLVISNTYNPFIYFRF